MGHFQCSQENATLRWKKKTKKVYDKPKHQNLSYNLKWKHLQKKLQIFQNFLQIFLQENIKCFY